MKKITEIQYNMLNELKEYANEKEIVYELNCPIIETSKGKFKIVGYELHIKNGILWDKFQEELLSNAIIIF